MMALLALLLLPPVPASHLGAALAGYPDLGPTLAAITRRESSGQWVSIHPGDSWAAPHAWRGALARGWLSSSCGWHSSPDGMSTRGSFGLIASYSLRHLGLPCLPPWVLDVPIVSAFVAAKRAGSKRCGQVARCASWRDVG